MRIILHIRCLKAQGLAAALNSEKSSLFIRWISTPLRFVKASELSR
jgi:hypothetical protein